MPILLCAVFILGFSFHSAFAAQSGWVSADNIQARLVAAVDSIGPQASDFEAALQIRLEEGWHSYWRSPGEAGLAPSFGWEMSDNIKDVKVSWPAPQRFDEAGLQTFGYTGDIAFPLRVTLTETGRPARLNLAAGIMICKDICIPQIINLALEIPAGIGVSSSEAQFIAYAKRKVPAAENTPALKIETIVSGPDGLVVSAYSAQGFDEADLFVEGPDIFMTARPDIILDADEPRRALMKIAPPETGQSVTTLLKGQKIRVTLTAVGEAAEKEIGF